MQHKKIVIALVLSGIIGSPVTTFANDSTELEELRALVQELSQQVKVLARKGEVAEEDAVAAKKTTPIVKASSSGFGLESADGKNSIKFSGLLQADYRSYQDGANDVRNRSNQRAGSLDENGFHDANDTALLRRVRPTIQGTLFGKYDFRFTPDFAGGGASAVDAYLDARLDPAFKIRAGKYKPYVGLERLQGGGDLKFVERSYVTNAILPNRDLGVSIYGDVFGDKLNYAFGVNNGVVDGGNISTGTEFDGSKEVTARLFATPFKDQTNALSGLGFGIAGTYTNIDGERNLNFTDTSAADATRNGLPSYLTDGQQTFFRYNGAAVADGRRTRITPQAYYYYGPLGVITEYARVNQEVSLSSGGSAAAGGAGTDTLITSGTTKSLSHDAWQVAASYLLTGEDASFKGVKPKQDFDIDKGGWGAWELVARYSELNLDSDTFKNKAGTSFAAASAYADLSTSAKSAKSWVAGVNWYLNQNAKIQLNYTHTTFDGGAGIGRTAINAAGTNVRDRESENALLARFQVAF
ncbi:OprO/OprP family phosphate-selective porin [Methylotenera versatilis]|uniref:OprO/OprP family phosphate-selective porin n=1 Tax=Methylotenera versatilis TaxID=1055487 RepID=UPI000648923E|nr:porin [Methylotenera versatilis]